jgi:hypothetical protein
MQKDYTKLAAIISHSENKEIHFLPILKIISLYCKKWRLEEDYEIISRLAKTIFTERGLIRET